NGFRTISQHLNDLKKENFSLKLRIYFLEERIQGKCEDGSREDVHRKNIELKVEVGSLKQELLERQQQLDKALTETQRNQNGADVQRQGEEKRQEISHIQEVLENKIQLLQEESKLAKSEAEKMSALAASESQRRVDLENRMRVMETKETQEEMLAEKERLIQNLTEDLVRKEEEERSLHEEADSLSRKVTQLEEELQVLSTSFQQKDRDMKDPKHLEVVRMLDSKTKDLCRICARELYGNQRRWIFNPTNKLSLQVLLSHALGRQVSRDGQREFSCSKCAFMLDRMYRFDTVIARVEALSIERMQKLLLEKERLRQCIGGLYRKNNQEEIESEMVKSGTEASIVETPAPSDSKYSSLLEEDLTYSVYECWAENDSQEHGGPHQHQQHHPHHHSHQCQAGSEAGRAQHSRKCRGCTTLRVADSDYEAICKVPRKVGRSTSCGPSTRYSVSNLASMEEAEPGSEPQETAAPSSSLTEISQTAEEENTSLSPASSIESLDAAGEPCSLVHPDLLQEKKDMLPIAITEQSPKTGVELALSLVKSFEWRPVRVFRGSRLPVPIKPVATNQILQSETDCPFSLHPPDMAPLSIQQELRLDLAEIEALWMDDYVPCGPLGFQEKLIAEQQVQLVQYENAAGQCVTELQKAQGQVQSLQAKIRASDASNKELQERLEVMELDMLSCRETVEGQERTILTLRDCLSTKDSEIADLHQLIDEQKQLLTSLKQQKLQTSTPAPDPLQAELLELQASLFSSQLELQSVQRTQRQAQRREDELARANQRLHADLQGVQDRHREAQKHNQELLAGLQRARSDLERMVEKLKEGKEDKERELEERERTIRELKTKLQHKERLLHDYTELLDGQKEGGGNRDILVHKLKLRIQERDQALEHAVDEKFVCVEQKEVEVRKLQLLLREKERDLQKLRCVLSGNEETIMSLELLVQGKCLELEQVSEAWRSSQRGQREREDRHASSMRDRDTLISQLRTTLHTRAKEAEEVTAALLSKVPLSSSEVVEKLNAQLQTKERLFQEILAEHNRQAQEHHTHIQELLDAICTREQCIKDSAERTGQVISEQAVRIQELRRQVVSADSASASTSEPPKDLQLLQEELQLVFSKERQAQRELSILRSALANTQEQLQAQNAQLHTVKHTNMNFKKEKKESLYSKYTLYGQKYWDNGLFQPYVILPKPLSRSWRHGIVKNAFVCGSIFLLLELGDPNLFKNENTPVHEDLLSMDVEEEENDANSELTESTEEEEQCRVTAQALSKMQHGGPVLHQSPAEVEGQGLAEVKLLVEQKQVVERELWELKAQLGKAGFTSFSQMRKALLSLRSENEAFRMAVEKSGTDEETHTTRLPDEQRGRGVQWQPQAREKQCSKMLCFDPGAAFSPSTQERRTVSKTSIPTEQLRHFRGQIMETPVQRDSKQVQVDLQDLGYETCGRSENEAERDDTSSPEFDDLDLCTSLSCRDGASQWWAGPGAMEQAEADVASLQQQVEDLQVELSHSQALVLSLQGRLQDTTPNSTPGNSTRDDRELRELVTRVSSLEEQLRKGKGHGEQGEEKTKSTSRTGKFDTLIQAQARELSHLRQRLREGRSACHVLNQHLGDTTKSFEELLRANDIDYYMSQSFRDQLAQSSALAQRVGAKLSSRQCIHTHTNTHTHTHTHTIHYTLQYYILLYIQYIQYDFRMKIFFNTGDYSEIADDKTGHELLAMRLSKELQQKDKLIESLRAKLEQQQEQSGEDTPTRDHSVSGDAEQSEHSSFVMDEQGEDLDLCSELDAVSEFGQEEQADGTPFFILSHTYPSNAPSVTSSHDHRSTSSCPSMHCTPHRPPDGQIQTEPNSTPMPQSSQFLPAQMAFLPFDPHTQHPRPRSSTTGGFSLAEVHQELQRLQRQLANNFSGAQVKPLPSDFHRTDLHLPSQHAFQQSPFASLHPSPNMAYGPRREGSYNDVSLSSSGFHSGARHTGTDLIEEHLREIRSFHRRLEESIQTNERLRQQLAERLGSKIQEGGAPTNIYIQGLDSVSQLSTEVRVLKEENQALQSRLQQASRVDGVKQVEQLRDAVLLERSRLQQAELEAEKWAGQFRQVQAQMREQTNAFLQLKQDKQVIRENANRLQHEVQILQQQLTESRRVVHALQYELQIYHRLHDSKDVQEPPSHTYTMKETLNDRLDPDVLHLSARKHIFHDSPQPPPVQDEGLLTSALFIPAQLQASRGPEGEVRDGLFACRTGCHVVGHWDDFIPLQQQLLEGKALICKMEATLQSGMEINPQEGCLRSMLASTKTFKQILEEMGSALKMFWRAALPNAETPEHQKEQTLREEVVSLRHKLAEQETTLKDTFETLRNSNRTKDSMEQLIVSQLSRTRDVLKKARSNLE
ncbi:myomegalin isoform X2, partial [Silurus asotus]